MKLDEILSGAGRHKRRKRIGRGTGSGRGKTCGRGHKGYGSRSGSRRRLGYEGGQTPALSRIPKRGFSNARFRADWQVGNLAVRDRFEEGARVDAAALAEARLIQDAGKPVKILARGQVNKKLTVVANGFSTAAAEKIAQAGGAAEQV